MDICMCGEYTYNPSANLLSSYHWYTIISTPDMVLCIPSNWQQWYVSGCVLSTSAWTARDQQPHWLTWCVIQLRIRQKY